MARTGMLKPQMTACHFIKLFYDWFWQYWQPDWEAGFRCQVYAFRWTLTFCVFISGTSCSCSSSSSSPEWWWSLLMDLYPENSIGAYSQSWSTRNNPLVGFAIGWISICILDSTCVPTYPFYIIFRCRKLVPILRIQVQRMVTNPWMLVLLLPRYQGFIGCILAKRD